MKSYIYLSVFVFFILFTPFTPPCSTPVFLPVDNLPFLPPRILPCFPHLPSSLPQPPYLFVVGRLWGGFRVYDLQFTPPQTTEYTPSPVPLENG